VRKYINSPWYVNPKAATFIDETNLENATLVVYQRFPDGEASVLARAQVTYSQGRIVVEPSGSNRIRGESAGGNGTLYMTTFLIRVHHRDQATPIEVYHTSEITATESGTTITHRS
jgi:hypothetical protein